MTAEVQLLSPHSTDEGREIPSGQSVGLILESVLFLSALKFPSKPGVNSQQTTKI